VTLPGSKSISNRVLLLAALSSGRTVMHDLLDSDATAVMPQALIAQIELVMLSAILEWYKTNGKLVSVPQPCPLLATCCYKRSEQYTERRACLTAVTMWSVNKSAAAAKSCPQQLAVYITRNQMTRRRNLRSSGPAFKITARVRRCRVELQRLPGNICKII